MAKRKNKNQNHGEGGGLGIFKKISSLRSQINPETEKSIIAIFFICFAVILILASVQKAGPAGEFIFLQLTLLFGLGYYLFPFIMLIMAGDFLVGEDEKYRDLPIRLFGALFFIMSGLGLIDVICDEKGGLVGQWMGAIQVPFGYIASIIIICTAILASLLLALNIPLKIKLKNEDKGEEEGIKNKPIEDFKITGLENSEETLIKEKLIEKNEKDKNSEKETKDKDEKYKNTETKTRKPFFMPKKGSPEEDFLKPQINTESSGMNYTPPPLNLLKSQVEKPTPGDLRANANIIKRTLDSFGIPIEMGEISIGPKVTRYSLKPAEGIKLSRITALNQDLALALAAHPIRMEAPIPGKSLVGIEVPNKSAAIVRLGSLITSPEFINSESLGFILGRDVTGKLITGNLAKMPHLLIAGSTGSGKSVAIHALLVSLLYKNSPETLKLILIDPKRVELTIYDDIPHLISPVITEGKKALGVFRWAISEMERRYEQLQDAGVRDMESYNKKHNEEKLPYIVIVVDELADLMTAYGRDIESSVVRLAQMARATGIHLVLSTQRPSVEVITGLIKANISARIALKVASQVDSRTILDIAGAEKLLGGGDMLFTTSELSKPKRIQGAFISEEELHAITSFIKERNEGDEDSETSLSFNPENIRKDINDINFDEFEKEDDDELFDEAVKIVREAKKASTSFLQRKLAIGYARAARLIDMMEERGIVGPGEGAKARIVISD
ncbi:DNA translocase FtsK [Patescibacteria group bacterium]|nr:DNA translocase FtsK [Patescibacteria group bacterium]